jgi:hypothetical protein
MHCLPAVSAPQPNINALSAKLYTTWASCVLLWPPVHTTTHKRCPSLWSHHNLN